MPAAIPSVATSKTRDAREGSGRQRARRRRAGPPESLRQPRQKESGRRDHHVLDGPPVPPVDGDQRRRHGNVERRGRQDERVGQVGGRPRSGRPRREHEPSPDRERRQQPRRRRQRSFERRQVLLQRMRPRQSVEARHRRPDVGAAHREGLDQIGLPEDDSDLHEVEAQRRDRVFLDPAPGERVRGVADGELSLREHARRELLELVAAVVPEARGVRVVSEKGRIAACRVQKREPVERGLVAERPGQHRRVLYGHEEKGLRERAAQPLAARERAEQPEGAQVVRDRARQRREREDRPGARRQAPRLRRSGRREDEKNEEQQERREEILRGDEAWQQDRAWKSGEQHRGGDPGPIAPEAARQRRCDEDGRGAQGAVQHLRREERVPGGEEEDAREQDRVERRIVGVHASRNRFVSAVLGQVQAAVVVRPEIGDGRGRNPEDGGEAEQESGGGDRDDPSGEGCGGPWRERARAAVQSPRILAALRAGAVAVSPPP